MRSQGPVAFTIARAGIGRNDAIFVGRRMEPQRRIRREAELELGPIGLIRRRPYGEVSLIAQHAKVFSCASVRLGRFAAAVTTMRPLTKESAGRSYAPGR